MITPSTSSFDDNHVIALFYLDGRDSSPYIVIRCHDRNHPLPRYSRRGIHELCIHRSGRTLRLDRWSFSQQRSQPWVLLSFLTWEGEALNISRPWRHCDAIVEVPRADKGTELVLVHCTFLALKCRSALTSNVNPQEYRLSREESLFQAWVPNPPVPLVA